MDITAHVTAAVEAYVALSVGMRFEDKQLFWDAEEPRPLLKPEEAAEPLIGWSSIHDYWDGTRGVLRGLRARCSGISVARLSPRIAVAHYHLEWRASIDAAFLDRGPLGSHVRVLAAFRRRAAEWRLFCYVEGHLDAVAYARLIGIDEEARAA